MSQRILVIPADLLRTWATERLNVIEEYPYGWGSEDAMDAHYHVALEILAWPEGWTITQDAYAVVFPGPLSPTDRGLSRAELIAKLREVRTLVEAACSA